MWNEGLNWKPSAMLDLLSFRHTDTGESHYNENYGTEALISISSLKFESKVRVVTSMHSVQFDQTRFLYQRALM